MSRSMLHRARCFEDSPDPRKHPQDTSIPAGNRLSPVALGAGAVDAMSKVVAVTRIGVCEQVLTNAQVVVADEVIAGTVQIVDGHVVAVDASNSSLPAALDLEGDYLIPGLVDVHTDNLERHLEPRPGVNWPGLAALVAHDRQMLAAGITTVFDSLCIGQRDDGRARRPEILGESLQAMAGARADGMLQAEHFLHARCEVSADAVVETFADLADHPAIRLVSVMDHTPGQRQWRNVGRWREFHLGEAFSEAQLDRIYERRTSQRADISAAARRDVAEICRQRRLTLASHDDATAEHVAEALAVGVTISEFPTTEIAAQAARAAGMHVVMGAPNAVLGASHSGNVSARALAADGLVDGFASDYVPESLLQACFVLHDVLGAPLPDAVASVSLIPAAMVGLTDRGRIAPRLRADLLWVRVYAGVPIVRGVWCGGIRIR